MKKISIAVSAVFLIAAVWSLIAQTVNNLPSSTSPPLYGRDGVRMNVGYSVYASGTAYSLTATPAALDFGTTDPALTISTPGTYLIFARANLKYNGATFAAGRTATIKLRRTNNTAGDLTNGSDSFVTDIITTITRTWQNIALAPVIYTTANNNDSLTIFGDVSVTPTAGSLDVTSASIVAIRLYE